MKNYFLNIYQKTNPLGANSLLVFCIFLFIFKSYGQEAPHPKKVELDNPTPSLESKRELALDEAPDVYVVESGDSLFEICDQLLNDGEYWPKLWSLNPFIKNPHLIWPGMRLQFYPGDHGNAMVMDIGKEDDYLPLDKKRIVASDLLKPKVSLEQIMTPLKPTEFITLDDIPANDELFSTMGQIYKNELRQIEIPGFILSQQISPICTVISGITDEEYIWEENTFLCLSQSDGISLNQTYTVIRKNNDYPNQENHYGYHYHYIGQIKLTKKLEDDNIMQGVVTKIRLGLQKDDMIVPFLSVKRSIPLNTKEGIKAPTQAEIIGFEDFELEFGGEGNIVFLNKGSKDGLQNGQSFFIHQSMISTEISNSHRINELVPVGIVNILDTTELGAVGYISKNNKEIAVGDIVGL